MDILIRKGEPKDVKAVLQLIQELANYEKAPQEVEVTEEELLNDGFGEHPVYELIVAEVNNEVVGIALFYTKYSTWKGKCIYLEDLVVTTSMRQKGIGSLLFEAVAKVGKTRQVKRMEWQVLEWNEPAIQFYKKYNANIDPEWYNGKLVFDQLQAF
tara:strand:- start:219 stop:686 length:468 start_codon:yes stop_codon:yes gene_type:complete